MTSAKLACAHWVAADVKCSLVAFTMRRRRSETCLTLAGVLTLCRGVPVFRALLLLIIPSTMKLQYISLRQAEFRGISLEEQQEFLKEYHDSCSPE
jgi:hypothetical protein